MKASVLVATVVAAGVDAGPVVAACGDGWMGVNLVATPQVKYRTSIIVWIFLALIGALVVLGIGVAVIGGK